MKLWSAKRRGDTVTEPEVQEEVAKQKLRNAIDRLAEIERLQRGIDSCATETLTEDTRRFVSWLDRLEAIGLEEVNAYIRKNRIRESVGNPFNPMQSLMTSLEVEKNRLSVEASNLIQTLPALEERAYKSKVDRLTLEYARDSVELTKRNIHFSLWIPVIAFLIGTIVFECFEPEITSWTRRLVGLGSLPPETTLQPYQGQRHGQLHERLLAVRPIK